MSDTGSAAGVAMPPPRISERPMRGVPGLTILVGSVVSLLAGVALVVIGGVLLGGSYGVGGLPLGLGVLLVAGAALGAAGLTPVAPGQARVVQLFGGYVGTIRTEGLRWVNPFMVRRSISVRIRNHETGIAKVNDADGNPIEVAAVVVWRVDDTAKARFEVDGFVRFVAIQSESAVRRIAGSYPYDSHGADQLSLRENAEEITARLSDEIAARVASAGVTVVESRITRLSYAPEIASAMLRRQQANAVVAARQRIVEGAVGMVELALDRLTEQGVVALDEDRRATMVSNLLVVLCGDREPQPVVNTGSLYQ